LCVDWHLSDPFLQLEQAAADTALLSLKQEPIAVTTLHLAAHHLPEAERAAIAAHRSMFVIKVLSRGALDEMVVNYGNHLLPEHRPKFGLSSIDISLFGVFSTMSMGAIVLTH
jgi:hypothetical protein